MEDRSYNEPCGISLRRGKVRVIRFVFLSSLATAAGFLLVATLPAHAAPLDFTSATPVALTSPSTTLTIATNSFADSLTVNATSVLVGMSATTGGSFTIVSPTYGLSVTKTNGDGVLAATCSSNLVDTLVLSQASGATTYTIVPTRGACTPAATSTTPAPAPVPVGGSVLPPSFKIDNGAAITTSSTVTLSFAAPPTVASFVITTAYGNESSTATSSFASTISLNLCAGFASCGSGSYTVAVNFLDSNGGFIASSSESIDYLPTGTAVPPVTPTSTPAVATSTLTNIPKNATTSELETFLAALETELQTLLKEAAAKGITISGVPSSTVSSSPYVFTRNLSLWDQGQDVNKLQRYLVAQDKGPAAEALARHGTTDTFGPLTYAALKEFQKAVGILPDSGYFGPITRGYVRTHGE